MNNYSNYTVTDFVQDQFFQEWVLRPDKATNSFWELWLKAHPEKTASINESKMIIAMLKFPFYRLSDNEVKELWCRIKNP